MKRAILVLIILTLAVTLPPLYSQWAESQRIKQIQTVKQQARPVVGDRLETVLSGLESGEPPSVVILYTGSTRSHLEPCGCYQEQSGGLPRRAYVVDQFRKRGIQTLLVDAGNLFDGDAEIDARRCETHIKALAAMRYSAVALSESDLSYADTYLRRQHAAATFPFLAPDAGHNDFTQPFVVEQVRQHNVAFVVGEVDEEVAAQSDVVVALGDPKDPEHIDVVISPDEISATVSKDGPIYVGCKSEGKTLGVLALWMDADGGVARHYATELALTAEVGESEPVRQLLTNFYREFASETPLQDSRLFAKQLLEQQ